MSERGVAVDHTTIYRWVQQYAPEMEKRLKWYLRSPLHQSWRVDETYVKVKGQWVYLYRAVDKHGATIDFYLSPTRNAKAAKCFLGRCRPWRATRRPVVRGRCRARTDFRSGGGACLRNNFV